MKNLGYALGILMAVFFGMSSNAQEVGGQKGPMISVDKDVHDYGTIEQGANGECQFVVKNTGTEPLILSSCKGSCGCTVPTCPQEPIAPGASSSIKVKYDTNRVGPINKSVTITSNAANEPNKVIRIKGNITAKPAEGGTTPDNSNH